MIYGKRYLAVFLVKEQMTYNVLKVRRFKPDILEVQYVKGKTFRIDVSKPTYAKGLKLFYFVDIERGQISYEKGKGDIINPHLIDMILKQSIVKQLTAGLSEKSIGSRIFDIVLGFLGGGLIGYIVGGLL